MTHISQQSPITSTVTSDSGLPGLNAKDILQSPVVQSGLWIAFLVFLIVFLARNFSSELGVLLGRIKKAEWPGGAVEFNPPPGKQELVSSIGLERRPLISTKEKLDPNDAPEFWLGHDLMWTIDAAWRGGPLAMLVHGLKQAAYQAEGIGLKYQAAEIAKIRDELERTGEPSGTERAILAGRIHEVIEACAKEIVEKLMARIPER